MHTRLKMKCSAKYNVNTMLTEVGEWRLLRGDLRGDCIVFCGVSAFPGDAADFRGDFRGGLAEF